MKQKLLSAHLILVSLGMAFLLSACGSSGEEATPTLSPEQIQTQAVADFAAGLTATALAMPPTATETPTPTASSTSGLTNTPASTPTNPVIVATSSCYGMAFVSDVTIPDNTRMTPGQVFTKTWRVRNSGSCAWEAGSRLRFTGGEAMGGTAVTVETAVQPAKETDLSVALTAPLAAGTYRGNWRMSTAGGAYFGDEVYLVIVVSGSTATATLNVSATPTLAPTATPTDTPVP